MRYQPTHGARALSRKLFATRPSSPIGDRHRRALRAIQHALTAQPIEHLHTLTVGRLSRFELILQSYEAWCLAHPDEPAPKHMLAVANAWRRTGEFLALLEERMQRSGDSSGTACANCQGRFPNLQSYLDHAPGCRAQQRPPVAAEVPSP